MKNNILQKLSYGVYIVGTMDDNRKVGCALNSAMQITANPQTIAISVNHDNYTNQCIKQNGRFSLSVLHEKSKKELIGTFGYHSSKETDKFMEFDYEMIQDVPVICDSCGYVVCNVISTLETSTHTIFVGEVIESKTYHDYQPMTYQYYHEVLKGKTPKNAPTYVEEDIKKEITTNKWKCKVCGYIYEGDELPKDFKCPICGVGIEMFEKVE